MRTLRQHYVVFEDQTAVKMGSGDLEVLATPALVAMMENCSKNLISEELSNGQTSVGYKMDLRHLAPTAVGSKIEVASEIVYSDAKKISFAIRAFEGETLIGEAKHTRVIVEHSDFLKKVKQKHNM